MSKYVAGFEDVGAGGKWRAVVLGLAVAAALLGLPVSAALLPEVFLTSLFYTTHFLYNSSLASNARSGSCLCSIT